MDSLWPFGRGAAFGASLIVAIGAQNAYVLRQGIKGHRVLTVALVSILGDALLISLGVGGFAALISRNPAVTQLVGGLGAAFLFFYALRAARAALKPGALTASAETDAPRGLMATALTTAAFSLLNPHVYLDTVVLFGSMAAQLPLDSRPLFAAGGVTASTIWFFGLAFGARKLAPLFERPAAWRVLDACVALICLWLAVGLVRGVLAAHGA